MSGFGGSAAASGSGTCVETKLAQPSASWRSGGFFERPIMPVQAAPSFGQPRPISRLGGSGYPGRPYRPWLRHDEARVRPGACCGRW